MIAENQVWRHRYPNTMKFLRENLPVIRAREPAVWRAFCDTARLDDDDAARRVVSFNDEPPVLWFRDLGGVVGFFDPKKPNFVTLSTTLAKKFEAASDQPIARQFLQATVLHEMVHWSLKDQGGLEPREAEAGNEFEIAAYDRVLPPFWENGASAGTSVSTGVSSGVSTGTSTGTRTGSSTTADTDERDHGLIHTGTGVRDFSVYDIAIGLPRGIRNNNPGNIKRSGTAWEGLADPQEMTDYQRRETTFCVFREPIWGLRALARVLSVYQVKYQCDMVETMIAKYAPPQDKNDTDAYIAFVAGRMNIATNQRFDFGDFDNRAYPMMTAIIRLENSRLQPYSRDQIEHAHRLGNLPKDTPV